MISIYKLFSEMANVHSEHSSGIVAPFGIIDPSERNKILLMQAQNISMKDPEEQAKFMSKLRGE